MSSAKCTYGQRAVPRETRHSSHNQRHLAFHGPSAIQMPALPTPKSFLICRPECRYGLDPAILCATIGPPRLWSRHPPQIRHRLRSLVFYLLTRHAGNQHPPRIVGLVLCRIRPFIPLIAVQNTFTQSNERTRSKLGWRQPRTSGLKIPTGSIYAADQGDITQKLTRRAL